jgi:hypothetical protein
MTCSSGKRLSTGRKVGVVSVYGSKTRALQRRISFEQFGLTFKTIQLFKYLGSRENDIPSDDDLQSPIFFEVPDRAYACNPIEVPVGMEPIQESKMDFSRFGLIDPTQDEATFRMHVDDFQFIGRAPIVGDVFEVPFYSTCDAKALWEITDVDRRVEAEKFYCVISATPFTASRKTREIESINNEDILDEFMSEIDTEVSEDVPAATVGFDNDPVTPEDVDYRNKDQASFLDDPTKTF